MNIVCKNCGEEKASNKFYFHSVDNKFMQPCKVCWMQKQKNRTIKPETRDYQNKNQREKYKSRENLSIKSLTEYVHALSDLADWSRGLVFSRHSGEIPKGERPDIERVTSVSRVQIDRVVMMPVRREYRFQWTGYEWVAGFYGDLVGWVTISRHNDMRSAQRAAMNLQDEIENNKKS